MTDMVERVARALLAGDIENYGDEVVEKTIPCWRTHSWLYKKRARSSIAAMREPTDGMIKAAAETDGMKAVDGMVMVAFIHGQKLPDGKPSPLLQAWRAAIDAALQEDKP